MDFFVNISQGFHKGQTEYDNWKLINTAIVSCLAGFEYFLFGPLKMM